MAQEADPRGILAIAVPVTLFPSPFPRVCFDQAVAVQKDYNALYAAISQDESFLAQIVKEYVVLRCAAKALASVGATLTASQYRRQRRLHYRAMEGPSSGQGRRLCSGRPTGGSHDPETELTAL